MSQPIEYVRIILVCNLPGPGSENGEKDVPKGSTVSTLLEDLTGSANFNNYLVRVKKMAELVTETAEPHYTLSTGDKVIISPKKVDAGDFFSRKPGKKARKKANRKPVQTGYDLAEANSVFFWDHNPSR